MRPSTWSGPRLEPSQGSQLRAKAETTGGPASRWVWLDHRCLKDSRTRSATDPATGHPEILWEWREVERHRTRAPRAWSQGKRTARPSSQAGQRLTGPFQRPDLTRNSTDNRRARLVRTPAARRLSSPLPSRDFPSPSGMSRSRRPIGPKRLKQFPCSQLPRCRGPFRKTRKARIRTSRGSRP